MKIGIIKKLKMIISGERPLIDVWHYTLGNFRYKLWYWKANYNYSHKYIRWIYRINLHKLIRKHIREQIEYRIRWMDEECYNSGSCKICGCSTIALQMCNKSCDKPCYPPMMNKNKWRNYNKGHAIFDNKLKAHWIKMISKQGKPILVKETKYSYVQNN